MEKCKCFEKNISPYYSFYTGRCMGTREKDGCMCNGDETKCDFYPEKRGEEMKAMNTLEMLKEAEETKQTYISNIKDSHSMRYNCEFGFHDCNKNQWEGYAFDFVNDLFTISSWSVLPNNAMTKEEAEKRYKIVIMD